MAGLFSCSDDTVLPDGNEGGTEAVAEGYLALCVQAGDEAEEKIRAYEELYERTVQSVRIVLYDGKENVSDPLVKYAFDFDIRTNDTGDGYTDGGSGGLPNLYVDAAKPTGKYRFITYARAVAQQDYKMLVIINPVKGEDGSAEGRLHAVTKPGNKLSELNKPVQIGKALLTNAQGGIASIEKKYFLMSNFQGLVSVPASQLHETPELANENPVMVTVDRAVAKIIVDQQKGGLTVKPSGGRISDLTWEADATNKWTYWMRMPTLKKGGVMEQQGDTDRGNMYAEDPNFKGLIGTGQGREADLAYNFNFLPAEASLTNALGTHQYVLENTMTADITDPAEITRVRVSCYYAPPGFDLQESYFTYNSVSISQSKIIEYKNASGESGFPEELKGLKSAILKAETELGIRVDNPQASFRSTGGLAYFHTGKNYYSIPIRHFSSVQSGHYGYYGVVRNHVYKVTLESIEGPGIPLNPGEEPEEPKPPTPPAESKYLSARIHVMPWTSKSQQSEVGEELEEPVLQRSEPPEFIWVTAGDNPIYGSGIPGSKIKVIWPNDSETRDINVNGGGEWIAYPPNTLYNGDLIKATQTEPGKSESIEKYYQIDRFG